MKLKLKVCILMLILVIIPMDYVSGKRNLIRKRKPCDGLPDKSFTVNPKGCKFFWYCVNGRGVEVFCPNGMWFNADTKICDQPNNVECHFDDHLTNVPTIATNPTRPSSETPLPTHPTATIMPPNNNNGSEIIICPQRDPNKIKFISSKLNCGRYYICYHGKAIRQDCIGALHWNIKENRCDHPEEAKCTINGAQPSKLPNCPNSGLQFLPHPTVCNYFIYCRDGLYSVQQCPFYHHWDTSTKTCRWRKFAHCTIK